MIQGCAKVNRISEAVVCSGKGKGRGKGEAKGKGRGKSSKGIEAVPKAVPKKKTIKENGKAVIEKGTEKKVKAAAMPPAPGKFPPCPPAAKHLPIHYGPCTIYWAPDKWRIKPCPGSRKTIGVARSTGWETVKAKVLAL